MRIHPTRSLLLVLLLLLVGTTYGFSESPLPATDLPVIITSCGQSPGSTMLKVVFMKLKLEKGSYEENSLVTADELRPKKTRARPTKP